MLLLTCAIYYLLQLEGSCWKIITIHQRHLAATIRTFLKSHPPKEELNHYRSLQPFPTINIDFIVPVQIQNLVD
ncbi:hypothetical protein OUZ56_006041 [Daphnia magna]|uniref:Secreted protein n=1 Tax=Daphnia magna TaxID=35525 RepID=A0ABQ9YUH4_9CRUS|nr:hypothetical protein OUZ56_006041 [Daphnia magna]